MTMVQITAAYPNIAKLEEAAHEEIMCRECCDTSDKWQDEASPEAVLALIELMKKMAAENVGLKSAIEKHADSYIMCGYCRTERDGKNDDVCEVLDSIPATDAFLAEVRAQGVGAFADHLSGLNITASETSTREFANQLREGKL